VQAPTSLNYAALKEYLRSIGKPVPENDIWIAALAVQHMASLITADTHFDHLPQVAHVVE